MSHLKVTASLGSGHYLRQGGSANKGVQKKSVQGNGGGANFQCKPLEGSKISVHRDLKALLKHLEYPPKNFRCRHIQYNTTTLANVPNVTGHFDMMFNADIITMTSSKFTC